MKPILLGLSNPYSDNPRHALAPFPKRSTGWRLWRMMDGVRPIDAKRYMNAFDRRNLFGTHEPVGKAERQAIAKDFLSTIPLGSTIVLLGTDLQECISPILSGAIKRVLIHPQVIDGFTWRCLPHPSGRSPLYNDPVMRNLAGMMLAEVLDSTGE